MLKPNAMIRIIDYKENKAYMVNATTHKFYSHNQRFANPSAITGAALAGILTTILQYASSQTTAIFPQRFKVLIVVITVAVATLLAWMLKRKRYEPDLAEYLEKYPYAKEISNEESIERILGKAQVQVFGVMIASPILLFWSVFEFSRFMREGELGSYVLAMLLLFVFSMAISRMGHATFILKLATHMNSNNEE